MPAKPSKAQKAFKGTKTKKAVGSGKDKGVGAKPLAKGPRGGGAADPSAEVKRLAQEVELLRAELAKRVAAGGDGAASRRDQDKALADRLARLDEKVDALWSRLSDLEDRLEGEGGGGRSREADFDEPPDREFYEHS
ncbi:MAG TPA: hypothetical protein VI337_02745 [Nitrospirales bacterium]|nr:hypothetical protein [Nitrospirales bacterium]